MGECILIIGGAKSGKSTYALNLCRDMKKRRIFLATAQPIDEEMKDKIKKHKEERGPGWITVEEPVRIAERIKELNKEDTVILLDCLTLWANNILLHDLDREKELDKLKDALLHSKGTIVVVSNEVGMGIVPSDELSRRYRDFLGYANQQIACLANKVILMTAGIPVIIKS